MNRWWLLPWQFMNPSAQKWKNNFSTCITLRQIKACQLHVLLYYTWVVSRQSGFTRGSDSRVWLQEWIINQLLSLDFWTSLFTFYILANVFLKIRPNVVALSNRNGGVSVNVQRKAIHKHIQSLSLFIYIYIIYFKLKCFELLFVCQIVLPLKCRHLKKNYWAMQHFWEIAVFA